MHPFPHHYQATAKGGATGEVAVEAPSLPAIPTHSPAEFDGPGDRWSPETLLCAAVADCFILTFRALAKAAGLSFRDLQCRVEGVLDRVERVTQMTSFTTHAALTLDAGADEAKARELLEKSEQRCLIANSLKGARHLVCEIHR